jgi:hypothetical protein
VAIPGYEPEPLKKMVRYETVREPHQGPTLQAKTMSLCP